MSSRDRAFAAIIKDGNILMVHIKDGKRDFWTLPGGGVESGETMEETVIREVSEEVNLEVKVIRYLFDREYTEGTEYCFLTEIIGDKEPILGYDPELDEENQILKSIEWKPLESVKDDIHVKLVLQAFSQLEMDDFKRWAYD